VLPSRSLRRAAFLILPAFVTAVSFVPASSQTSPPGIAGVQAFAPSVVWAWGVRGRSFFLTRSGDAGLTWQPCELPPDARTHAESPSIGETENEAEPVTFDVLAIDANSVRLTWTKPGSSAFVAAAMELAETHDICTHWASFEGTLPHEGAPTENVAVQWLLDHQRGWAFMTGGCCGSGQQNTTLLRTEDGGHTWQSLRGPKEHGVPDWYNEGFMMRSWDEGWLASASFSSPHPGLLRLSAGGDVWADIGSSLPVPEGVPSDSVDFFGATAPVFSASDPMDGAFTAELQYLVGAGAAEHGGRAVVRYTTNDGGRTWQVSKLMMTEALILLQLPPQGAQFFDQAKTLGYRVEYGENGKAQSLTAIRNGRIAERVQFPLTNSFNRIYAPVGARDPKLLFGEIREPVNGTGQYKIVALFRSRDEGKTWQFLLN
jgi:hypothetical protein